MADTVEDLIAAIKADPEYKKFRLVIKEARRRMKLQANENEAMALMAGRVSRSLYGGKQFSPKAMLEASSCDMAARARLVEMRTKLKLNVDPIDQACKALKNHVMTEYVQEMRVFSNAEARQAFIERVQGLAKQVSGQVASLIDLMDQIVKDIDSASYAITTMREMIVILNGSQGSKVI